MGGVENQQRILITAHNQTTWFAMSNLMPPAADRFSGKQPPRKKRMTEKDREERRKLYEEEKRERVFDPEDTMAMGCIHNNSLFIARYVGNIKMQGELYWNQLILVMLCTLTNPA